MKASQDVILDDSGLLQNITQTVMSLTQDVSRQRHQQYITLMRDIFQ